MQNLTKKKIKTVLDSYAFNKFSRSLGKRSFLISFVFSEIILQAKGYVKLESVFIRLKCALSKHRNFT